MCMADKFPIIHLIFSNLKTWINGTHHGVSPQHLQAYLNEFVFPFNAFRSLLGLSVAHESPTYEELYDGDWNHPGTTRWERWMITGKAWKVQ